MTIQNIQNQLALLARQVAKAANKNPHLNDAADTLFVTCLKLDVPKDQLPQ